MISFLDDPIFQIINSMSVEKFIKSEDTKQQNDLIYKNRVQISLRGFVVIKNLFPTKQLGFLFGSFCISKYIPTSIKVFFVKLNSLHSLTMICIFTIMIKRMKFIDVVGHYIFLIVHCQETSMTK
jgi:hypothetical protein